ncbi:MAG TPA: LysM domain-containing protein, partial [Armatimonadota bacterium]|nr:LysM domain-containing protein [Armatimonadota bacterium]
MRKATLLALGGVLLTVTGPAQADQIHIVRWGETLNSISRRYHVETDVVRDKNKLRNPNHIEVGTRLVIPDAAKETTSQSAPVAKLAAPADKPAIT